jgi:hypothetical protein
MELKTELNMNSFHVDHPDGERGTSPPPTMNRAASSSSPPPNHAASSSSSEDDSTFPVPGAAFALHGAVVPYPAVRRTSVEIIGGDGRRKDATPRHVVGRRSVGKMCQGSAVDRFREQCFAW